MKQKKQFWDNHSSRMKELNSTLDRLNKNRENDKETGKEKIEDNRRALDDLLK